MSNTRVKLARVVGGVVEILQNEEYYPADDVQMLNTGEEDSEGVVLINSSTCRYLTNTQIDTTYLLNNIVNVIEQLISVTDAEYLINANTPVFGKMVSFEPVTQALQDLKEGLQGHKMI